LVSVASVDGEPGPVTPDDRSLDATASADIDTGAGRSRGSGVWRCPAVKTDGGRITVVLIDGQTLFRQGLRELMSADDIFTVVGEGSSADDLLALVGAYEPDVLLFDLDISAEDLAATLAHAVRTSPRTRMVLLTMARDPVASRAVLEWGANGCVAKTIGREELMAAVWLVSRAREYTLTLVPAASEATVPSRSPLSPRELEVLRLLTQARTNAQIGRQLHISESTVKRHLTKIYAKLRAVSRVDALNKAVAARLLCVPESSSTIGSDEG
jgi:DNA-binding NarL/FixJ family response regulator